jgi:hypothetical protein
MAPLRVDLGRIVMQVEEEVLEVLEEEQLKMLVEMEALALHFLGMSL